MSERKTLVFKGQLNWAKVQEPEIAEDHKSAKYSVEVEATKAQYDALIKAGLSPLTKLKEKDGKTFINIKRKAWTIDASGNKKTRTPIRVVDKNKQDLKALVGNGSTGAVIAELVPTPNSKFVKAILELHTVVVHDLVEYTAGNSADIENALDSLTESSGVVDDIASNGVDEAFI
jgi:hypothetical protein